MKDRPREARRARSPDRTTLPVARACVAPGTVRGALSWTRRRHLTKWLALFPARAHVRRKLLIEASAVGLPREHLVRHVLDDARGVTDDDLPVRDFHSGWDERQRPHHALGSDARRVRDDGVHSDERVPPDRRAMYHRAVADVCALFEENRGARKHVDDAPLLHVASVADQNFPPITAQRGAGTDVDVASDDDVAGHGSLRMHERR